MTPAEPGRLRRVVSAVRHWRDWPLAAKLVALMLAPAAVIFALGGVVISSQVQTAREAATQAQLVRLDVRAHSVVAALRGGGHGEAPALAGAARSFGDALRGAKPGVGPAPAPLPRAVSARATAADRALHTVLVAPAGSAAGTDGARAAVLDVEQSVAAHLAEPSLAGLASSLHRRDSGAAPADVAAADSTAKKLSATARGRADSSSNRIGITAVLLLVAVLVCAAVAVIIARALVVSLGRLRSRADEVAERGLPDAARRVRAGEQISTDVTPIPVTTGDELGALARSFEAVEGQALRLAAEQAGLRTEAGGVFVNLSRRSQSLVQRQLRLLERLERDEENPEQLDALFQLDHLATRMRRNNENLMVLSGAEPARGGTATMTVTEVLQAAVSEIEQYERVRIAPATEATVVGYAAGDLVRMLAELLENATSFSAPETTVALTSEFTIEGTLLLDILDEGVGMSQSDLAAANTGLAGSEPGELPAARQMGLFVVGRLAAQYGIAVRLSTPEGPQGVRASLTLPPLLLARGVGESEVEEAGDGEPESAPGPAWTREAESATPLPTRQRGQAARAAGIPVAASGTGESADRPAPAAAVPSAEETTDTIRGSWFLPSPRSGGQPQVDLFAPEAPAGESPTGDVAEVRGPELGEESFDVFAVAAPGEEAVPAPAVAPEGTPIFDDMASAWFVETPAAAERGPDGAAAGLEAAALAGFPTVEWSDTDNGWQQADAVARQEPASFTDSGLPVRTPRARLVPGSMAAGGEHDLRAEEGKRRDPGGVRDRYQGFVRGLSEGGRGQPVEQSSTQSSTPEREAAELTPSGLPKRRRGARLLPRDEGGGAPSSPQTSEQVRDRLASLQRGISRGRAEGRSQANTQEGFDDQDSE
jgi:signal transduction histidine kinase